jgi:hypothetical protein
MKTSQSGFGKFTIIVLAALLGGAYFIKDNQGVSYLQRGIDMARYYTVTRNTDAIKAANDVKAVAQKQQDALQEELNR